MKHIYKVIILLIVIIVTSSSAFAQFNYKGSLFSDVKASEIDDAITILIVEDTRSTSGANTSLTKQDALTTGLSGSVGAIMSGTANADVTAGSNFQANGTSGRTESIQTKLHMMINFCKKCS